MADRVIRFPVTSTAAEAAPTPARRSRLNSPVTTLAAVLRWSPSTFDPTRVARDLLDAGGNDAARPIWAMRWAAFGDILAARGIRGQNADELRRQWRLAVRKAGIAEKARRRAGLVAAERFFESLQINGPGFAFALERDDER